MTEPLRDPIYDRCAADDVTALLYRIASLAKAGCAASDTLMRIDMNPSDHQAIYELIADLAARAVTLAPERPAAEG